MLVLKSLQPGGHHTAAAQVTDNFAMVGAIDDREASDVIAEHFRGGFGHKLVRVSDHQPSAAGFLNGHRAGRIFIERAEQVASSDDAGKFSGVIENQQSLMASHGGIMLRDALCQCAHRSTSGDGRQFLLHRVDDSGLGENVRFVILMNPQAAAC